MPDMVMRSHRITAGGVPVRWEEAGAGFPVVFVHGIPTAPAMWRDVVPLVRGARCLAFEMVGYGHSIPQGLGRDISVAQQAAYLDAWLDALAIDRAVLVGHDLGGGVAQIAAVRHPSRCAGLVLVNAIGYDSWPIPAVRLLRRVGALGALPDRAARLFLAAFLRRGHDNAAGARAALELYWPAYAAHGGAAALLRQMRSLRTEDTLTVAADLPTLGVPARVVWGTDDPFQKIDHGARMARDLRADLERVEGGRHWIPEDHPGTVAAAVTAVVEAAS
jgi:pimeloyl-ACP methyl ester carboxylesterase